MRQLPDHRAAGSPFPATVPAPPIVFSEAAFQDWAVAADVLASDLQAEGVEEAEAVQVRGGESRLGHVEVFQMVSVGTSIFGRPRPLSPTATPLLPRGCFYTLKREEPDKHLCTDTTDTTRFDPRNHARIEDVGAPTPTDTRKMTWAMKNASPTATDLGCPLLQW